MSSDASLSPASRLLQTGDAPERNFPGCFWMALHWSLCRRRRSALGRECGFAHTSMLPGKTQVPCRSRLAGEHVGSGAAVSPDPLRSPASQLLQTGMFQNAISLGASGWPCIEASAAGVGARLPANAVLLIHRRCLAERNFPVGAGLLANPLDQAQPCRLIHRFRQHADCCRYSPAQCDATVALRSSCASLWHVFPAPRKPPAPAPRG